MAEIFTADQVYGDYVGNGCCCSPACCKLKMSPSPCMPGNDCICLQPGIFGCGPICPVICSLPYYRASCCGPNVWCMIPCESPQKFTTADAMEPCCCGCGVGYVKDKGAGGPGGQEEMER